MFLKLVLNVLSGPYFYPESRSMSIRYLLLAAVLFFTLPSCKKKKGTTDVPPMDTTQTYFSIRQFMQDQIASYREQPYSLNRFATLNGKTDSSMVNFSNMEWAPIYKAFLETDISAVKYLGRYRFSQFEAGAAGNIVLSYEAKEPELFTRNLQITIDPANNKILSIYIESAKDGSKQKLLYIPLKVIQIQDDEVSWTGTKRNLRLEYRFL